MIFDLDGTLVDSINDLAYSVNRLRQFYHLPKLPTKKIASFIGKGVNNLVKDSLFDAPHIPFDQALKKGIEIYQDNMFKKTTVYDGYHQLIKVLNKHKIQKAILSNKLQSLLNQLAKHLGLDKEFPIILGPETVPPKPSPIGIKKILTQFSIHPQHCLMVGDSLADILAGENANIRTCFLKNGIGTFEPNQKVDFVLKDIKELASLINQNK